MDRASPWLVVGLGNPGQRYASTRHNIGTMVVERLCERLGVRLRKVRFSSVTAAEATSGGVPLILALSGTWMNESGPPVASLAKRRGVSVDHVVVVHDEIDLPWAAIRVKRGGSTAGHHGLDSLVQAFRSGDFYRVRLGVGRPPSREAGADHVLRRLSKRQQEEIDVLVEEGADAALSLVADGLTRTQERFNRGAPASS